MTHDQDSRLTDSPHADSPRPQPAHRIHLGKPSIGKPTLRRPSAAGLFGIGAALGLIGAAVSGSAVYGAIRRKVREMEVPPRELAKQKWTQTKAATVAGIGAWQRGAKAHLHAGTHQHAAQNAPIPPNAQPPLKTHST